MPNPQPPPISRAGTELARWVVCLGSPGMRGETSMGKCLALWEIDETKIPIDAKERGAGSAPLVALV